MPCQDNYPDYNDNKYNNRMPAYIYRDNPEHVKTIQELTQKIGWLEAGLCAIITELEKESKSKTNEILTNASRNGKISLIDFWTKHSKDDEVRLVNELHKFSAHEQDVIKRLLNVKSEQTYSVEDFVNYDLSNLEVGDKVMLVKRYECNNTIDVYEIFTVTKVERYLDNIHSYRIKSDKGYIMTLLSLNANGNFATNKQNLKNEK